MAYKIRPELGDVTEFDARSRIARSRLAVLGEEGTYNDLRRLKRKSYSFSDSELRSMMEAATLRVVSYGGGVQSTALLVLAAQGKIDYPIFLMSNVGDDSESPQTLKYVAEVAHPYARDNGLTMIEVCNTVHGNPVTLLSELNRTDVDRWGMLPMRLERSGAPGNRKCTKDFKITPVYRWLRANGATRKNPALLALGISTDEIQRAKPAYNELNPAQLKTYPLLELGISRTDCVDIISDAGLPVPGKSSCWFCPYTPPSEWQRRRQEDPVMFLSGVDLETRLSARSEAHGHGKLFMAKKGMTLMDITNESSSDDGGDCESGYCWT